MYRAVEGGRPGRSVRSLPRSCRSTCTSPSIASVLSEGPLDARGQLALRQEGHLLDSVGTFYPQDVAAEVDDAVVAAQRVQPEQEVHVVVVQHGLRPVELGQRDLKKGVEEGALTTEMGKTEWPKAI